MAMPVATRGMFRGSVDHHDGAPMPSCSRTMRCTSSVLAACIETSSRNVRKSDPCSCSPTFSPPPTCPTSPSISGCKPSRASFGWTETPSRISRTDALSHCPVPNPPPSHVPSHGRPGTVSQCSPVCCCSGPGPCGAGGACSLFRSSRKRSEGTCVAPPLARASHSLKSSCDSGSNEDQCTHQPINHSTQSGFNCPPVSSLWVRPVTWIIFPSVKSLL